ncbi:transposase, partial [Tenacibaculum finnmarkense]|uniref:transposase n=1 Tax=Tenacibaculum finnmarkense TaxID=2781243 RepID=UPI0030D9494D
MSSNFQNNFLTYTLCVILPNTAANSLNYHLETIVNFFKNRHTNANAESFNSKIKLVRANQR